MLRTKLRNLLNSADPSSSDDEEQDGENQEQQLRTHQNCKLQDQTPLNLDDGADGGGGGGGEEEEEEEIHSSPHCGVRKRMQVDEERRTRKKVGTSTEWSSLSAADQSASCAISVSPPKNCPCATPITFDEHLCMFQGISPEMESEIAKAQFSPAEMVKHGQEIFRILDHVSQNGLARNHHDLAIVGPNDADESVFKPDGSRKQMSDFSCRGNPKKLFTLLEVVDSGAFAQVHRAVVKKDRSIVAIKIIKVTENSKQTSLENEILMHATSNHPNIVDFKGLWIYRDELWIVMEYMTLGKLTKAIEHSGPFNELEIAAVLRPVVCALDYLARRGRIHRDVKSDNIMVSADGTVKLGDFGFTRELGPATSHFSVVGTPAWMAPEIIRGDKYNQVVDVWSTGILALEMCDGEPPLLNEPQLRALVMIVTGPPPMPRCPARWSKTFRGFLSRALEKDQFNRATTQELLAHPFLVNAPLETQFLKSKMLS